MFRTLFNLESLMLIICQNFNMFITIYITFKQIIYDGTLKTRINHKLKMILITTKINISKKYS